MTVYLVYFLPKIPYIFGFGLPYFYVIVKVAMRLRSHGICSVYTVFLAWTSLNIWSCTVHVVHMFWPALIMLGAVYTQLTLLQVLVGV
jgi:hypothetical protein